MLIHKESDRQIAINLVKSAPIGHEVIVRKYDKKRSNPQNKLYWEYLTIIAKDTGYTKDELHSYFAKKFLGFQTVEIFGESSTIINSTTDLNTKEFGDYLMEIEAVAIDLGIILPVPALRGLE